MAASIGARALRAVLRAPVALFRAGYGPVFAGRFLMLGHTGRRTGLRRFVVLEVVGRTADDRYVVVAGLGERADWYRNVRRDPRVRVWVGAHRDAPATARVLDDDEARRQLATYRADHPVAWRMLGPVLVRLTGRVGQPDEDLLGAVPLVELSLDTVSGG